MGTGAVVTDKLKIPGVVNDSDDDTWAQPPGGPTSALRRSQSPRNGSTIKSPRFAPPPIIEAYHSPTSWQDDTTFVEEVATNALRQASDANADALRQASAANADVPRTPQTYSEGFPLLPGIVSQQVT